MTHFTARTRFGVSILTVAAATLAIAGCSTVGSTGSAEGGGDDDTFTVGFAVGGQPDADWQELQGDVAAALAEQRGWEFVELSNDNSEETATKNDDLFIQEG